MAALTVFSAAVCLAGVLLLCQPQSSEGVDQHLLNVAHANNRFALDMYKRLTKSDRDNVIFSPFAIGSSLAMTLLGAKGKSATQLKKVLHLTDVDEEWVHPSYRTLLDNFHDNRGTADYMLLASKMFMEDDFTFKANYLSETKVFYEEPERINFGKDAEAAREHINKWAETQARLADLVAPEDVDAKTLLILASGMRFRKVWHNKFEERLTRPFQFFRAPGQVLDSQVMIQHGMFKTIYDEELLARIVELPFEDGKRNMVILFPSGTGLNALTDMEAKLTYEQIEHMHHNTTRHPMDVLLPKFKLEDTINLEEVLNPMGLRTVFSSEKSDLSKMSKKALYISQFLSKSSIEIAEDGVKLTKVDELPAVRERFVAMRPFLFYIEDVPTGTILMMGRIRNPSNVPTDAPRPVEDDDTTEESDSETVGHDEL